MNDSVNGYASYSVSPSVTSHTAYGLGVYSYFNQGVNIIANSGITVPVTSGVTVTHAVTVFLSGSGQITYTIASDNGTIDNAGTVAQPGSITSYVTSYGGSGGSCTAVPPAPTGLTATASSSSTISLSWSAVNPPANCAISSYSVYGSTTSGFTPSSTNLIASGLTSTSYSNAGLAPSTTYYYVVEAADADGTSSASSQASATTPVASGSDIVAIDSGGPAVSNSNGGDASFVADEDYSGGGTATSTNTIVTAGVTNAAPAAVYQSERAGVFTYTIPGLVAGSSHTVLLHFAEFYWTAAGKRVFNVAINGAPVLSNFDIYATVGANKALVEQFAATANSSGQMVISYTSGTADQPKSSGIEIR